MTLTDHLREWADHLHLCASLAARARVPTHHDLTNGEPGPDWLRMLSMRERGVIEAMIAEGVWAPPEVTE